MANDNVGGNPFMAIGDAFPRLCNLVTLIVGGFFVLDESGTGTDFGLSGTALGLVLIVVGLHGVFTRPSTVGILRKFLSYMGAAGGAAVIINVAMQMLGQA